MPSDDWSAEETDDPLNADRRNFLARQQNCLFCLPTYRKKHYPVGSEGRSQLGSISRKTTIRRLLSQSSSQIPLAHSHYARNGKALTIPVRNARPWGSSAHTHALTLPRGCLYIGYLGHPHQCRALAISARANCCGTPNFDNDDETTMRILSVWVLEFIKLLGRRRLHPLNAQCPICHQMVRLHYNKAGRRHLFAHARAYSRTLYGRVALRRALHGED